MKRKLREALALALPDGTKYFVVYSDVSAKDLGCVLILRYKVIFYVSV